MVELFGPKNDSTILLFSYGIRHGEAGSYIQGGPRPACFGFLTPGHQRKRAMHIKRFNYNSPNYTLSCFNAHGVAVIPGTHKAISRPPIISHACVTYIVARRSLYDDLASTDHTSYIISQTTRSYRLLGLQTRHTTCRFLRYGLSVGIIASHACRFHTRFQVAARPRTNFPSQVSTVFFFFETLVSRLQMQEEPPAPIFITYEKISM